MERNMSEPASYIASERARILALARAALAGHLGGSLPVDPVSASEAYLHEPRGCFVTLRRSRELRGCIGTFEADEALHAVVARMAAAAARDPRFTDKPVTLDELGELEIHVSILTPMRRLDDPLSLRIGIDGVYIRRVVGEREQSGCFLPCVAVEQGWDVATTLSMCCAHKMRLPADAWRKLSDMEFYAFEAVEIAEHPGG
jgi:AmmeMemoRadiSam system protein A